MTKPTKILFITPKITPYVSATEMSEIGRKLPQEIQEKGYEIRTFMPKWGNINERRNQLHEVIRLSGMNLIVDDTDHPLIIKVASLQSARMQVYFIDNEDFFADCHDGQEVNVGDTAESDCRPVFFARGVLETVKKLRWTPDVIHCHGWLTSLVPLYIKRSYKDEPSFRETKVVFSLYNDDFPATFAEGLKDKVMLKGIKKDELALLDGTPGHGELCKLAIDYADGVLVNSNEVNAELLNHAKAGGKPVQETYLPETYAEDCEAFYRQMLPERD